MTLLGSSPEIEFVALKNIELILQKHPTFIQNVSIFFCKYDDPIFVKVAKLAIIAQLVDEKNISKVLGELQLYATEIDVDFVRRAVRIIGRCALMIENTAPECVKVLVQLLESKISYVVQEATIVMRDIYRRYPNQFSSVLDKIVDGAKFLDEEEDSKAAFIWILGQYSHRLDDSGLIITEYLQNINEDGDLVQYSILTASMKLFFKKPDEGRKILPIVLKMITEDIDNPDLRDRGYMYWRMLASDPIAAQKIIMGDKPVISLMSNAMDSDKLGKLLHHLSTLSALTFVTPSLTDIQSKKIVSMHNRGLALLNELKKKSTNKNASDKPVKPKREKYQMAEQGMYTVNDTNSIIPQQNYNSKKESERYSTGIGELPLDLFSNEPYVPQNTQNTYQNYTNYSNSSRGSPVINDLRGFDPLMPSIMSEHNPFLVTNNIARQQTATAPNPFLNNQPISQQPQPVVQSHFDSDLIGLDVLRSTPNLNADSVIDPFRQTSLNPVQQPIQQLDPGMQIFLNPQTSDGLKVAGHCIAF